MPFETTHELGFLAAQIPSDNPAEILFALPKIALRQSPRNPLGQNVPTIRQQMSPI